MPYFIIDPSSRMLYTSYYIKGMIDLVGFDNVIFVFKPFEEIHKVGYEDMFEGCMAFVFSYYGKNIKYIFDFHDDIHLNKCAYEWCDYYGKVNLYPVFQKKYEKVFPLAPGFGVQLFDSQLQSIKLGIINFIKSGKSILKLKSFMAGYISRKRIRLEKYEDYISDPDDNYVFSLSRFWSHNDGETKVNYWRALFYKTIMEKFTDINFEGGFVCESDLMPERYSNLSHTSKISLLKYLQKIRDSLFVFNTGAVHNCHGWKLPEFLLLGKAIISTRLQNLLPDKLSHGENIHFINDEEDLVYAIKLLINDKIYREKLESGARAYYKENLEPSMVIKKSLRQANIEL